MDGGEHITNVVKPQKLRPTRTREETMIKMKSNGEGKFLNAGSAMLAAQAIQFAYSMLGNLTSSHFDTKAKCIEVTVHFSPTDCIALPRGYKYSEREIKSYTFYSRVSNQVEYVRVIDFYFKY